MKHLLSVSIGDAGVGEALECLARLPEYRELPTEGSVDDVPLTNFSHWPQDLAIAKKEGKVSWPTRCNADGFAQAIDVNPRTLPPRVYLQIPDAFATLQEGAAWIERLPFLVCSVGRIYVFQWAKMEIDSPSFGVGHVHHGWACAFRGAGHDRLVSRRWIDFGPWRVIRRADDLTIVQFHDLQADPATAATQARPGWERMGPSSTGGFLSFPYRFSYEVEGLYLPSTRTLEIVVPPGGKVEQVRMRDACAVRSRHNLDAAAAGRPIDQVAYVFVDEADARAHLHELWLRELEVWLVDGTGKRRLDDAYAPTLQPPAWVHQLDDSV